VGNPGRHEIFFTSPKRPYGFWSAPGLSIHWILEALFLEVEQPDYEAEHVLLSGAEFKNV